MSKQKIKPIKAYAVYDEEQQHISGFPQLYIYSFKRQLKNFNILSNEKIIEILITPLGDKK